MKLRSAPMLSFSHSNLESISERTENRSICVSYNECKAASHLFFKGGRSIMVKGKGKSKEGIRALCNGCLLRHCQQGLC